MIYKTELSLTRGLTYMLYITLSKKGSTRASWIFGRFFSRFSLVSLIACEQNFRFALEEKTEQKEN